MSLATAVLTIISKLISVIGLQNQQATQINNLSNKVNTLQAGGRNLLRNSSVHYNSAAYSTRYELTQAPTVGDDVIITLWGELGSDRTGIGVYNSIGHSEITRLQQVAAGVYRGVGKWRKPMRNNQEVVPNDTHLNVYFYPNGAVSNNTIKYIKLERGTVATDWTAAPEDAQATITALESRLAVLESKTANGTIGD